MTAIRSHVICCSLVGILSTLPIVIVLGLGIWGPVAVIWETFGVHYTAYPSLALNYHFIGNAMAFAVLYAYVPSYIVHMLADGISQFDRFSIYLLMVYGVHAALMVGAAVWIATKPLTLHAKVAVILVSGVLPLWLSTNYINLLSVNYFWLEVLLYPIAATLWVLLAAGRLNVNAGLTIFVGVALAFAGWTKFTYIVSVGIFLALPLLIASRQRMWQVFLILPATSLLTTVAIFFLYFAGHVEYAARFFNDLRGMYVSSFLLQRSPALWQELTQWPRADSAIQGAAFLAAVATLLGGAIYFRASVTHRILATTVLAIGGLMVPFLIARAAANTFMDATIFCSFAVAVWTAIFFEHPGHQRYAWGVLALYCSLTIWQVFGVFRLPEWLGKVEAASDSAREIDADIRSRGGQLPVVYYWYWPKTRGPIWHGSPLWPSPYLYALLSGPQETKQPYLQKYFPGSSIRSVLDGPEHVSHIMVIQEYLADESPLAAKIWGAFPEFDVVRADPQNQCRRHVVDTAWTDFEMPGKPVVTVCAVVEAERTSH